MNPMDERTFKALLRLLPRVFELELSAGAENSTYDDAMLLQQWADSVRDNYPTTRES